MSERDRLPNRRSCETVTFGHNGSRFALSIGYSRTGAVVEIFISSSRHVGSEAEAIARDAAILASIALQHGADLEVLRHALTRGHSGEPATIIGAALEALARPPATHVPPTPGEGPGRAS
jgi:hypothetical protein